MGLDNSRADSGPGRAGGAANDRSGGQGGHTSGSLAAQNAAKAGNSLAGVMAQAQAAADAAASRVRASDKRLERKATMRSWRGRLAAAETADNKVKAAKAQADAKADAEQAAMEETNRARAATEAAAKAAEDKAKAEMAETNRARVAAETTAKAAEDKAKADAEAAAMEETNRARTASEAKAKAAEDRANYEMAETNRARAASEAEAKAAEDKAKGIVPGGDIDETYTTPDTEVGAHPGGDDTTAISDEGGDGESASDIRNAIDEEREGSGEPAPAPPPDLMWQRDYDALMAEGDLIKAHWETIQKWRSDESDSHAQTRGTSINRMAGGGMQAESEQWGLNLGAIDAKHATAMEGFEDSATMGIINRWVEKLRKAEPLAKNTEFSRSGLTRGQYDERSTDDFMKANFGTIGGSVSASKAERSGVAAAQRRAPPRAIQTASPWWG